MSDPTTGAMERLWQRLLLVVGRGRIQTGNDAGPVQLQQVRVDALEIRDNTLRVAEYGFTSMPKPGCHAVMIFVGGDRSNGVIIGTNDQTARLKNLQPGEVAIYDDQGQSVYITRSGIVVNGGGQLVKITNTPQVRMECDLDVTGQIKDLCDTTGTTMAGMRTVFNTHTHADPQGGNVSAPTPTM